MSTNKKPAHPTSGERKNICTLLEQLDWFFGVATYDRKLEYVHEEKKSDKHEGRSVMADVLCEHDYQRLRIRLYPCFWEESTEGQRKGLLHEYCHILPARLQEHARNNWRERLVPEHIFDSAVEELTSSIENRLDALLRGRSQYMMKAYATYVAKPKPVHKGARAKGKRYTASKRG